MQQNSSHCILCTASQSGREERGGRGEDMSGGDQSIKARQSEIELFRQTKQKHTQARIQTVTDLNVLNTTLGARMEGKFEFIANYCCAPQFGSIVSGCERALQNV